MIGVEEIILHVTDGETEDQRNRDQVQGHTHGDSQDFLLRVLCFLQYTSLLMCTMSRHMQGAYVHTESNTVHLKAVHTDSTLSHR